LEIIQGPTDYIISYLDPRQNSIEVKGQIVFLRITPN